jgi:hypothetical protein
MPHARTGHIVTALFSIALLTACGADDPNSTAPTDETAGTGGSNDTGGALSSGATGGGGHTTSTGSSGTTNTVGAGGASNGGNSGAGGRSGGSGQGGTNTGGMTGSTDAGGHGGQINVDGGPASSRLTKKPLGGGSGAPNGFYEYLPAGYDGSAPAPLLLFWSGVGQEGNGTTDLPNVLAYGPPELISKDQWDKKRPFIVLSAQYTPKGGQIAPGVACPSGAIIDAFLTWALTAYNVDKKRVYLTGLSCGGIGTWDYLGKYRGSVVAAAVPISGNPGDPTQTDSAWGRAGCGLGEVAIRSFHGDKDDVVPFAPDQATMNDLIACPAPPRRKAVFTDVAGGGHGIWDPIYFLQGSYGDIYQWMLDNAKP